MALFESKRCPNADSMHWLLREPLINSVGFDVSSEITPGLTRSGTVTQQQLVDAVGLSLNNVQALGCLLELQST